MRTVGLAAASCLALLAALLGALWLARAPRGTKSGSRAEPTAQRSESARELAPPEGREALPTDEAGAGLDPSEVSRKPLADEPGTSRIRGRVIDAGTQAPVVPGVRLELHHRARRIVETVELAADGTFESVGRFPARGVRPQVLELHGGEVLPSRARAGETWTIEVDPGWLYYLDLAAPDGLVPDGGLARLLQSRSSDGAPASELFEVSSRIALSGEAHPYALFRTALREGERTIVAVEAACPRGRLSGRVEVDPRRGIHPEARVDLRLEPSARGRVVDLDGEPVEDAAVLLLPLEDSPSGSDGGDRREETGSLGTFVFEALEEREYRSSATFGFARSEPIRFRAAPGENDLGDIALPLAADAGTISGALIGPEGEEPFGVLVLESRDTGKRLVTTTELEIHLFRSSDDDEDGVARFEFERVPAGSYELSVIDVAGWKFEPESIAVSPPLETVEFRAIPRVRERWYVSVRDVGSEGPIQKYTVLGRTHDQWLPVVDEGDDWFFGGESWIVVAGGRRPARLERSDFHRASSPRRNDSDPGGDGLVDAWRAEIGLERGYGLALVFKNGEDDSLQATGNLESWIAPPLTGVRVLADGRPVATSDADGLALLSLEREPAALEFVLDGWRVGRDRTEDGLRRVLMIRE